MSQTFSTQLKYLFPERVSFGEPLKDYTSFGIGGPADCLITVETAAELKKLLALANDYQQSLFLLGKGTNVLVSDQGVQGVVIRLAGEFTQAEVRGNELIAGAASSISSLLRLSIQHTLSGLEFLVGLPGSLGGAVYMNAGSMNLGIGSLVKEVHLLYPDGSYGIKSREDLNFSYRRSALAEGETITRIVLQLRRSESKEDILSKIKEGYAYRVNHQPLKEKSAGCIFKNPPGGSAGRLIDLTGLKGFSIGDAQVSNLHANFFINRHRASCDQVLRLMDLVRKKVCQFCGLALEPEVLVWGISEDD